MRIYLIIITLLSLLISCNSNKSKNQHLNKIHEIDSINSLADNYQHYNIDTLIFNLKTNETNSLKINYLQGIQKSLFQQGKLLYIKNKYIEAKNKFEESKKISKNINDKIFEANCIERIASITLATTDPGLALKLYYESLLIYEKFNNEKGKAKIYNILGIYQLGKKNYHMAEEFLIKSLKIHQHLKDTHNIIENLGNLGYVYECKGEFKKAESIYIKLLKQTEIFNDRISLAVIYYNYASLLQKQNKLDQTIQILNKSIAISEENKDTSLLASLYGNIGEIYLNIKNYNKANIFLNRSCYFANTIKDYETELQAINFIIEINNLSGNYTKTIELYQKALILTDSIYIQKNRNNKLVIELDYQDKINKEIINKQSKNIELNNLHNLIIYISILLLALMALIFIILYKKRLNTLKQNLEIKSQKVLLQEMEKKSKLNEEEILKLKHEKAILKIKEKEKFLKNISLHFDHNNDVLNFIIEQIKEIKEKKSNEIKEEIILLENKINNRLKDANNDSLFNDYFNQIHADFFKNLKVKHPDLTLNEMKFCAYLKTHLSSNQIASILNVTNEAIRKTRYRIRKKLMLSQEISLENYLDKF